jgi:HK97 family phage prohead protease
MESNSLSIPFEIQSVETCKADDGEDFGRFTGLASTFGNVDRTGDIIAPGAFTSSIRNPRKIKMLWQHDPGEGPIGVWERMEETDKGLSVEGKLLLDVPRGQQAHTLMKARALDSMSIGFTVGKNGSDFDGESGNRVIKKIDLWEISVVTFPANTRARIQSVKQFNGFSTIKTKREYETFLRDVGGFSANQSKILAAAFKYTGDDLRDGEELDELRALIRERSQIFTSINGE